MYQVQFTLKHPKNLTPNEMHSPQELKAILQQKLTNLHLLKPVHVMSQKNPIDQIKKGQMLQIRKANLAKQPHKLGTNILSERFLKLIDHTIQDRYLIPPKQMEIDGMAQTHANGYYSQMPPKQEEHKTAQYFHQPKNPMFWSTDETTTTPSTNSVQGKKLPPLSIQHEKAKQPDKFPSPNARETTSIQSIFRPAAQEPFGKRSRNQHSNSNLDHLLQKESKTNLESSQHKDSSLLRSISTPFMNKKQEQAATSRSNSPKEAIKQNTEQAKPAKPKLKPLPPKKQPNINSPIGGQSTNRPANSETQDSNSITTTETQAKKKIMFKKKKAQVKPMLSPADEKIILRHTSFRAFINKINFSNNICITSPKPMAVPAYQIYIGKGNNSSLVRSAFKWRWWWQEVDTSDVNTIHMSWTQLRQNNFLDALRPFDSDDSPTFSGHLDHSLQDADIDSSDSELDARSKSVRIRQPPARPSLQSNTVTLQQQTFKPTNVVSLRKVLNPRDLALLSQFMEKSGLKDSQQVFSDCTEQLLANIKKVVTYQRLDSVEYKMHNHLENNWNLSNKKALFYNMKAYYENINGDYSKYLPLTFHIQQGTKDKEFERLVEYYNRRIEEIKEQEEKFKTTAPASYFDRKQISQKQKSNRNIWIVKPGEMTNRGTGISVCSDLNEITALVSSGEMHPNGKLKTYIVQQYIENPFLYNKRKFDIRCYMLMTSQNGILKGYWYQEGYIRTTSKEYSTKNFNIMIHLTNDAVQKKGEEYGKFESGNKISFLEFQRYLDMNYSDQHLSFYNDVYPKMRSLALDTIRAVYGKIDPRRRSNSFELFGLDFMIDDNFKLWLIEVNTNPCLELSCPLLSRIIPSLVENVLRIAVDPIFPPPFIDEWPANKKQFSPDNVLENNKFELVFDELVDFKAMKNILKNNNAVTEIFDIEEMEEEEDDE